MRIGMNTTAQEVKDKTKTILVQMCDKSTEPSKEENPGKAIRELFDMFREHSDSKEKLKARLAEIQELIKKERNHELSIEELLNFINNAMNYGKFQAWLLEKELEGEELSFEDKLNTFLSETSNEDILALYSTGQNYNANNLRAIDKMIEEDGSLNNSDCSNEEVTISEESRRILAKGLIR